MLHKHLFVVWIGDDFQLFFGISRKTGLPGFKLKARPLQIFRQKMPIVSHRETAISWKNFPIELERRGLWLVEMGCITPCPENSRNFWL